MKNFYFSLLFIPLILVSCGAQLNDTPDQGSSEVSSSDNNFSCETEWGHFSNDSSANDNLFWSSESNENCENLSSSSVFLSSSEEVLTPEDSLIEVFRDSIKEYKDSILASNYICPNNPNLIHPIASDSNKVLLSENFDGESLSDFGVKLNSLLFARKTSEVGTDFSNALKVAYVGYERGSKRLVLSYPLKRKVKSVLMSFDVCFDEDFQWVKVGKLHGVGPKNVVTGGGDRRPNGWSSRLEFKTDGYLLTYNYDQEPDKVYGTTKTSEQPVLTKGVWQNIQVEIKINDYEMSNGYQLVKVDNQVIIENKDIQLHNYADSTVYIQKFLFHTFHGGSKIEHSPIDELGNPTIVHAFFDNFIVIDLD